MTVCTGGSSSGGKFDAVEMGFSRGTGRNSNCAAEFSRLTIVIHLCLRLVNERAWKLRALRYALLPSSSCMLLELMEMLFPFTSYIIVLQKRFNELLK